MGSRDSNNVMMQKEASSSFQTSCNTSSRLRQQPQQPFGTASGHHSRVSSNDMGPADMGSLGSALDLMTVQGIHSPKSSMLMMNDCLGSADGGVGGERGSSRMGSFSFPPFLHGHSSGFLSMNLSAPSTPVSASDLMGTQEKKVRSFVPWCDS